MKIASCRVSPISPESPGSYDVAMTRSERVRIFVQEIWAWYARHKRTLPWRDLKVVDDTQRAYMVLVSEMMLQQTQVPRVIPAFKAFLEHFPTLANLAKATNADVIRQWKGMGYNNRAIRLRDAARIVLDKHNGRFPSTTGDLLSIKGVGEYTAAAIRNFAFGIPTACIDTNIRRVLHRTFVGPEREDGTWKKDDAYLLKLAGEVLDVAMKTSGSRGVRSSPASPDSSVSPASCADWHAALMDFGSLVCTKRNPKWDICPLTKRGVMLASYKVKVRTKKLNKKEPGREIAGVFTPNRIVRGRIVDALRNHPELTLAQLGPHACVDWSMGNHRAWLEHIIAGLVRDGIVAKHAKTYALRQ